MRLTARITVGGGGYKTGKLLLPIKASPDVGNEHAAIAENKKADDAEQRKIDSKEVQDKKLQISYVHILACTNIHSSARQKGIKPRKFFLRTRPRSRGGAVRSTKLCGKKSRVMKKIYRKNLF